MTVKRAREIFKEKIAYLTDEEVALMIARDTQMIRSLFYVFDKFLTTDRHSVNNGIKVGSVNSL